MTALQSRVVTLTFPLGTLLNWARPCKETSPARGAAQTLAQAQAEAEVAELARHAEFAGRVLPQQNVVWVEVPIW